MEKDCIIILHSLNKTELISEIIRIYKEKWGTREYIGWLQNDMVGLVGYQMDLKNKKNKQGLKLWNDLNKQMGKSQLTKIKNIMKQLPIYALYSLIGCHFQSLQIKPEMRM